LGSVSCGRNGNTLLAPNALSQFGNILQVLWGIELNTWIQQQIAASL
jgi:hypothetical protein